MCIHWLYNILEATELDIIWSVDKSTQGISGTGARGNTEAWESEVNKDEN